MITLEETTLIQAPINRCFDLARSIEVHLIGTSDTGEEAIAGTTTGLIGMGESVTWRAKHFGVRQTLTSKITGFEPPSYFQDTMQQGAFRSLQHERLFKSLSAESTEMTDILKLAAPIPILGLLAEALVLRRYMQHFLRTRNRILKQLAESEYWQHYLSNEKS